MHYFKVRENIIVFNQQKFSGESVYFFVETFNNNDSSVIQFSLISICSYEALNIQHGTPVLRFYAIGLFHIESIYQILDPKIPIFISGINFWLEIRNRSN